MPEPLWPLLEWYAENARPLPWRRPDRTAWGVLVSEIMSQQTPVSRVEPYWCTWLERWPRPADLAAAPPAEVLRAWGTLGYPRRALRLRECARTIAADHAGRVPDDEAILRTLPGLGPYTAAAVAAFAYGRRALVLDVNIRRVLARVFGGIALPPPALTGAERAQAAAHLPADQAESVRWNQAVMEFGALVCTARAPACESCPQKVLAQLMPPPGLSCPEARVPAARPDSPCPDCACPLISLCAWREAGQPPDAFAPKRRGQAWTGTDRQARGRIMALLRDAPDGEGVSLGSIDIAWPRHEQTARALAGLVADGLAECRGGQAFLGSVAMASANLMR